MKMNRKAFVLTLAGVALAPKVIAAQLASPEASPVTDEDRRYPLEDTAGFVRSVTRSFELADPGLDIFLGGLIAVSGTGIEFESSDTASAALSELSTALPNFLEEGIGLDDDSGVVITDSTLTEVSVGALGDERIGVSVELTVVTDFFDTLALALAFIRKDRYLQVLMGYGITGVLAPTIDIAETLDAQWPSDDIWSIVPALADVPAGMALDDESELP